MPKASKGISIFVTVAILLGLLAIVAFINYHRLKNSSKNYDVTDNYFNNDVYSEMGSGYDFNLPANDIANKEYREFSDILRKTNNFSFEFYDRYYHKIGPVNILNALAEDYPFCHAESHSLGRVIYEKTKDLLISMNICGYRCTSGCFHGVIMQIFKDKFSQKITNDTEWLNYSDHIKIADDEIKSIMNSYCSKPEISRFIRTGNCYHGLGHAALFLADYNLSKALNFCKFLKNNNSIYYCTTGVFMEQDIAAEGSLSFDDKLYPCDIYDEFPAACYRYKVRRLFNSSKDPKSAVDFCLGLKGQQRLGCFHGLGTAFYRRIYKNPKLISGICTGSLNEQKMCLDGAIQLISVFNKTIAIDACKLMNNDVSWYCLKEADYRTFNMNKPLVLYRGLNNSSSID